MKSFTVVVDALHIVLAILYHVFHIVLTIIYQLLTSVVLPYHAIQAVTKKDFGPTLKLLGTFEKARDSKSIPQKPFKRSNDKCTAHNRYFEINLYTKEGVSCHHESTRLGCSFPRDASIDQVKGAVRKGRKTYFW